MAQTTLQVEEADQAPPACPRCGSSADFEDCDQCGGEGFIEDDDPDWEPDLIRCETCLGKGGWWRCASSYEWCQNNPLPGRENVRRAA